MLHEHLIGETLRIYPHVSFLITGCHASGRLNAENAYIKCGLVNLLPAAIPYRISTIVRRNCGSGHKIAQPLAPRLGWDELWLSWRDFVARQDLPGHFQLAENIGRNRGWPSGRLCPRNDIEEQTNESKIPVFQNSIRFRPSTDA